jgi:hypothetical protein
VYLEVLIRIQSVVQSPDKGVDPARSEMFSFVGVRVQEC